MTHIDIKTIFDINAKAKGEFGGMKHICYNGLFTRMIMEIEKIH